MKYFNRIVNNIKSMVKDDDKINGVDASYMLMKKPTIETIRKIGSCILYEKLTKDDFQRYSDGQLNTVLIFRGIDYFRMPNDFMDKVFSVVRQIGKNGLFHMVYGVKYSNHIRFFYVLKGDGKDTSEELSNIATYMSKMKAAGAKVAEVVDMDTVINDGTTYPPSFEREYVIMFTVNDEED